LSVNPGAAEAATADATRMTKGARKDGSIVRKVVGTNVVKAIREIFCWKLEAGRAAWLKYPGLPMHMGETPEPITCTGEQQL